MALITQLYSNTLSNQDITTALLVGTFTNTTRIRELTVNVFLDQVAGNGDYKVSLTIQRAGAGSAYQSIVTTLSLASGVTAGYVGTIPIQLNATDVLRVYVTGLAGDTTTPDIIVDINEKWQNIDANGNPNPTDSAGIATILADYARRTGDYSTLTAALVDTQLSGVHGSGAWGLVGAGAHSLTYTLTSSVGGTPIEGADVLAYTEAGMVNLVAAGVTDAFGVVTLNFSTAGTYYLKRVKSGYSFSNPDSEAVG